MRGKCKGCLRSHATTHADIQPETCQHVIMRSENAETDRRWYESRSERISAHGSRWCRQFQWNLVGLRG